jgi:hypothetical protein
MDSGAFCAALQLHRALVVASQELLVAAQFSGVAFFVDKAEMTIGKKKRELTEQPVVFYYKTAYNIWSVIKPQARSSS